MYIKRLMIVSGGTGGHIYPGLVIADYLKFNNCIVKWVGSLDRLEYILVPKHNIDIDFIYIPNIFSSKKKFLINFFFFLKSIYLITLKIKFWKPDLVLGFGGYISFVGIVAAWFCKIPTLIHEQNSVLGLSNKILYYIATKSLQAFPNTFNKNVPVVGNPIRKSLLNLLTPDERFLNRNGPIHVLVLGGSQGSCIINDVIFSLVCNLNMNNFFFFHQVGLLNFKDFLKRKHQKKIKNYRVVDFIYDMDKVYSWADLIISRSGALTVSELFSVGLASILVPFVHKDNQQYWNAKMLEDVGSAIIILESNFNLCSLFKIILSLTRKKLLYMSNLAYKNRIINPNENFINEINNL